MEVTQTAGITNQHHKPVLDHQLDNIMSWLSSVGAAAAAGDYNRDGWMDLYVTDSAKGHPNHLYRNNRDGTFTDVAPAAGLADLNDELGVSMDCVWGDYDGDGWPDLYLVRWGNDALFRNNGNGTFTEVSQKLFKKRDGGPGIDWANGNAVVFLDCNLDGRLDIYVGNYFDEVDLWHLENTRIMHDDFEKARNAGRNFLYRQNEDGTFAEVGATLGLDDPGWTLGVGSGDLNNDGWPDLYCADDFGPDQLFLNRGDGTFTNVTETAIGFDSKKGMNVEMGDLDQDGWLDIYVANITTAEYLQEGNMLWHNNGPDPDGHISFTDISLETGTYDGGWGWGAKFLDFDNDGDLDIVAVNGFISAGSGNYWYDLASWTVQGKDVSDARNWPTIHDRSFSGYEKTRFWRNDGPYLFSERAAELGVDSDRDGRGVVCFDYDNDGDLDLFVANQGQRPQLFRNEQTVTNHWLMVTLEVEPQAQVNRDGIGTRVTAVTKTGTQLRERDGGNGYSGQSDPRLHFGLGTNTGVQLLEVRWPDGGLQYWENVPADQVLIARQNREGYATQMTMTRSEPKRWERSSDVPERVVPHLEPAALDEMLTEMEKRLAASTDGYQLASTYRKRCADYGKHDRAIEFFAAQAKTQTNAWRMRVELACAYVDKIPTCGGMAAIVSKGTLARKSLDQLDMVVKEKPDLWVAHYTRGMNHLHWPRALRHSDDAAADFAWCVKTQEAAEPPNSQPYHEWSYVALGDAWAKAGNYLEARQAWKRGSKAFPKSTKLTARLAIKQDAELLRLIEKERNLEQPIDTDLSFLDGND